MAGTAQDEGSSSVTSHSPLWRFSGMSLAPVNSPYLPWLLELKSDERGMWLIQFLLNCAKQVADGNLDQADKFLEYISILASPDGDAMQRIASHLAEALSRRILRSLPGVYRTLLPARAAAFPLADAVAARRYFLDLCPFLRVAFAVSNLAIMEAMDEEKMIHIIDLNASDPTQWISLLHAFSSRPGGPPYLRITGVHENKELLSHVGTCLTQEAEKLRLPFQFYPVVSRLDNLDFESLRVKTGEALAINSVLGLHCLLATNDEGRSCRKMPTPAAHKFSAPQLQGMNQAAWREFLENEVGCTPSPDSALSPPFALPPAPKIESFLSALYGLSPKVLVITEQESNHNAPAMNDRFTRALNFYAALFDCLESAMPRQSVERVMVEKLFGEEMKNIIACEGLERTERHEKLERWAQRLEVAGFGRVALSFQGLLQAKRLVGNFACQGYNVNSENGCIMLCWQDRSLFSVSAWGCRR